MRARGLGVLLAVSALVVTGCTSAPVASPGPPTAVASATAVAAPEGSAPTTPVTADESSEGTDGHEHEEVPPEARSLFDTTRTELMTVQAERGSGRALALLERQIDDVPELAGVCHAIAHELGHEAVELAGGRARKALKNGTEVCGGGFIHGVIETVLGSSYELRKGPAACPRPHERRVCFTAWVTG